jgi:hypothetical protein
MNPQGNYIRTMLDICVGNAMRRGVFAICNVETTLSSYESHLTETHSNEEMATRLIEYKLLPYGNY